LQTIFQKKKFIWKVQSANVKSKNIPVFSSVLIVTI